MKISIIKTDKDYDLIIYGENNVIFHTIKINQKQLDELTKACNKFQTNEPSYEVKDYKIKNYKIPEL